MSEEQKRELWTKALQDLLEHIPYNIQTQIVKFRNIELEIRVLEIER